MEDLERMAIFASVAEAKSFSVAARKLGLSKSVVSRQVAQLEKSVGARLLNRTTRAMSLTEAGSVLQAHCARIVDELHEAKLAVAKLNSEPRGLLRITAPVAFGTLHVAPALTAFLARHAELRIELHITDRIVDLAEEGFDMAIRITREPGQLLVARKLAPDRRTMCATPAYFRRRGIPASPRDLSKHNCLTYTHLNPQGAWRLQGPDGPVEVKASGNLSVNDDEALSQAVLNGLGIAIL